MKGAPALRGQPLLVFVLLLAVWSLARANSWQSPLPVPQSEPAGPAAPAQAARPDTAPGPKAPAVERPALPPAAPAIADSPPARPVAPLSQTRAADLPPPPPLPQPLLAGHNALLVAGLSALPVPEALNAFYPPPAAEAEAMPRQPAAPADSPALAESDSFAPEGMISESF